MTASLWTFLDGLPVAWTFALIAAVVLATALPFIFARFSRVERRPGYLPQAFNADHSDRERLGMTTGHERSRRR